MDASVLSGDPASDGFAMPGEFEAHSGCIVIWPERPGSWGRNPQAARNAFRNVIAAIALSEAVYVAASPSCVDSAIDCLFNGKVIAGSTADSWRYDENSATLPKCQDSWCQNVEIFLAKTDDSWARDIAPTFVVRRESGTSRTQSSSSPYIRGVNWSFNAWGGHIDGAYADWDDDDSFARRFCSSYGYEIYDAAPFVLEGGSIHSDGEGTLLVTEACLLSAGRNPDLSHAQIEERLMAYTGARKVLWLPAGMYGDETNGHVDNICAFLRPGEVVLAGTENTADPQYPFSAACLDALETMTDANDRKLVVHKLPNPDVPICVTENDLENLVFEKGEQVRVAGERMAASYVNFYFSNNAVIMPIFGDENTPSDTRAIELMHAWCPERSIVPVRGRDILLGGGNIHCITQQIPADPISGIAQYFDTEEE